MINLLSVMKFYPASVDAENVLKQEETNDLLHKFFTLIKTNMKIEKYFR